ncbi:MAG: six-cysteine ranthipeptide SCIFF [Negativicutes bacterium]|nr:six-cysteine ranthipeptide SCIFF [Negativicutes bacterium]
MKDHETKPMIITLCNGRQGVKPGGCGECQASCQSACKTSCTVGNQVCQQQDR